MIKKIARVFGLIFIVFFILFVILKFGISISSLNFDFLKLEQLYIKIDKKLIVRAKKISFKEDDNASSIQSQSMAREIFDISKGLKYLYFFTQEINIENLNIKGQEFQFLFKNNEFFINNPTLFLKLNLQRTENEINANIIKMKVKDYNASVDGNISINTNSEFYFFSGKVTAPEVDFNASFSYKKNQLAYKLEDINIYDIEKVLLKINQKYNLDSHLLEWVGKKVKGDFYHFDYFSGFADLAHNNYYYDEIKAFGYAKNVLVKLDDNIDAIKIPHLDMNLSKQKLDFNFKEAAFNQYDISQSKVYLYDIMQSDKIGIFLHIKSSQLLLDKNVNKILKLYDIDLPFNQLSGKLKSDLILKIPFQAQNSVYYLGEFDMQDAKLDLFDLNVSAAKVILKDEKASIIVPNMESDFLKAELNASINFFQKQGIFDLNLSKLSLPMLLDMKNENMQFVFDFEGEKRLSSSEWGLDMNLSDGLFLRVHSFKKFEPYSELLQKFKFQNTEDITFYTKDFDNFEMVVKNGIFDSEFYANDKPYVKDSFFISKNSSGIKIRTQSELVSADLNDDVNHIFIKNLKLAYKNSDSEKITTHIVSKPTYINAQNSALFLQDFNKTLSFDNLKANLLNDHVKVVANYKQSDFDLEFNSEKMILKISNISDEVLNNFFGRTVVENGVFNFLIEGKSSKEYKGKIWIKNTHFTGLKFQNQLVSFLDTIPSLLLFKTPTFNEKGLNVEKGAVVFNRKGDILTLEGLNLDGDSIDILGTGVINLKSNVLNIDLQLKTLKSTSEAISKVPIINQIVLGKNREISTTVKVDGQIDNPEFHTQILTETLKTPLNLIKNIFELPANLFN
ncbi:AsmA-like C-terminal domain-containing protein [Campylobacter sp. US33a]|uniref:YhdP family protein n=1 Tax=Campylobacter sp. US33a TaxID=2498120 RepID=UPI00106774F7|nr:AsmA-like C-terminal domain-containing protein [Campylobacter sp. US33a]TEY01239.1 DUF3971 domain-containing protein [Campylobacter sp. US33a]